MKFRTPLIAAGIVLTVGSSAAGACTTRPVPKQPATPTTVTVHWLTSEAPGGRTPPVDASDVTWPQTYLASVPSCGTGVIQNDTYRYSGSDKTYVDSLISHGTLNRPGSSQWTDSSVIVSWTFTVMSPCPVVPSVPAPPAPPVIPPTTPVPTPGPSVSTPAPASVPAPAPGVPAVVPATPTPAPAPVVSASCLKLTLHRTGNKVRATVTVKATNASRYLTTYHWARGVANHSATHTFAVGKHSVSAVVWFRSVTGAAISSTCAAKVTIPKPKPLKTPAPLKLPFGCVATGGKATVDGITRPVVGCHGPDAGSG